MAEADGNDGRFWYQIAISPVIDTTISPEIMEKFSRLKCGEPQLKFCVKTLQLFGASLDFDSDRVKSNERAREFRNCGNDFFSSNGETAKAAEMYTKSIAYALPGSRELALAYANRSAVSFKANDYEECLLDIDRSLKNDYPEEMKAKLYARRVRCLVALKKSKAEIDEALEDTKKALSQMDLKASGRDLVEKTLSDKNHMAPATVTRNIMKRLKPRISDGSCDIRGATGITLKFSKKYGRHIVATRDIRAGEIFAVIDNYAHARSPDERYRECVKCGFPTSIGIPCDHCVDVIYCSTSCRDEAWNDFHEIECPILGMLLDLKFPANAMLGIRMTFKALKEAGSVVELKKMMTRIKSISDPRMKGFTGDVLDCTKYACIYTLTSHAGKHIDSSYVIAMVSTFTIYYLATRTEIFGRKYGTNLEIFNKNQLLIFLGVLMIRNCEIGQMTATGVGNDHLQIAPFTALCNHSCDSNVTSLGTNKNVVFALQPIKAGDQIWDTYGGLHYSSFSREERQKTLRQHYFFTCDCVACIKDWPTLDKLPSAYDIPGVSPTIRKQLSEIDKAYRNKFQQGMLTGDVLAAKEDLVKAIELLFEHVGPCKEIVNYRENLKNLHGYCLDPF